MPEGSSRLGKEQAVTKTNTSKVRTSRKEGVAVQAAGLSGSGYQQVFKNVDDILHKDAGCTSELDYTEQSSWLLFLKYLDALEESRAQEAALTG